MGTVFEYDQSVVLSQIPNVIHWLQNKANEAGPNTIQVSGLDCKVASDMVAGLLAEVKRLADENAAMRPVVEKVAEAGADFDYNGNSWLLFPGSFAAEQMREQARAYLAAHPVPESEA